MQALTFHSSNKLSDKYNQIICICIVGYVYIEHKLILLCTRSPLVLCALLSKRTW